MRRQVRWVEKREDTTKREIRVSFPGRGEIKWQFKTSGEAAWDYDTPPTTEDWDELIRLLEARYQRARIPFKDLELARRLATGA